MQRTGQATCVRELTDRGVAFAIALACGSSERGRPGCVHCVRPREAHGVQIGRSQWSGYTMATRRRRHSCSDYSTAALPMQAGGSTLNGSIYLQSLETNLPANDT